MFGLKKIWPSKKKLVDFLPEVRGRYDTDVLMSKYTWFGVGGPADVMFHPEDEEDLGYFLKMMPYNLPVCVIGGGSNLLIRDGGVPGVVIKLDAPSFRKIIHSYADNYSWFMFGVDLALGHELDRPASWREQMFIPVVLEEACREATVVTSSDTVSVAAPLICAERVLFDPGTSPVLPPTPWYLSPLFVAFAVFAAAVALTVKDVVRKKVSRWFDFIWFLIAGLAGCLVFFLVFVSEHEATSPNYLAFWLNPFCLVVPSLVFIKTLRKWLYFYHFINFALVLILLAVWGALPQCANAAFFPLMACSIIRSANYVYIEKCARKSR